MIEIHRTEALAQSYTYRVICAIELHKVEESEDRLEWIRKIETTIDTGSWKHIQCEYWIRNNPRDTLVLEAWIQSHFNQQPRVIAVVVINPHSSKFERWDFDSAGRPFRVK